MKKPNNPFWVVNALQCQSSNVTACFAHARMGRRGFTLGYACKASQAATCCNKPKPTFVPVTTELESSDFEMAPEYVGKIREHGVESRPRHLT